MVTMRDDHTHPLLAQVPLTVSPFLSLPSAATLPYTYKPMPSTLPPPITGVTGANSHHNSNSNSNPPKADKVPYVVAPQSGHAAHPTDIAASCLALQAHLSRTQTESARALGELEARIRARELAEKRRVAPGWLDSEARLLQPERRPGFAEADGGDGDGDGDGGDGGDVAATNQLMAEMSLAGRRESGAISEMAAVVVDQGEELDRAFGGMK
ncbi:uncharacterized protein GGS25DRAFT_283677 [Hypoxylon fragiforme]|uniref:uncharacterized protein n=1 Tax=Hypoxylon fragiforme TaxID=63214 RepID=UPI0020C72FC7|nr:uncharacterized protein GGS25DRAFT_283677 [Hypoxylon fragiforme]KAI2608573.1 hypothetical protein GGS25DRAFT_283677 [Hypoxylon fragiforme]